MDKKPYKSKFDKYIVSCPHCHQDVLDHMMECPYCGGKLEPMYQPIDSDKIRKTRWFLTVILIVVAFLIMASKFLH
ncbi:MAG: hypothetical protein JW702_10870 [Clostridiales bacterium]|nr:hypothetical protein [Clostridiales bacterium]